MVVMDVNEWVRLVEGSQCSLATCAGRLTVIQGSRVGAVCTRTAKCSICKRKAQHSNVPTTISRRPGVTRGRAPAFNLEMVAADVLNGGRHTRHTHQ